MKENSEKKNKKYEEIYDSDFDYKEENTTFLNTNFLNFLREKKEINYKRNEKIKFIQNNQKNLNKSNEQNYSQDPNSNLINNNDKGYEKKTNEIFFSNLNLSFDFKNKNNYIEKEKFNYSNNNSNNNNSCKNFQIPYEINRKNYFNYKKENSFRLENPYYRINAPIYPISSFNYNKENQDQLSNSNCDIYDDFNSSFD
jgi:hypothetical protein